MNITRYSINDIRLIDYCIYGCEISGLSKFYHCRYLNDVQYTGYDPAKLVNI